jgi:hypothetical protein
VNPHERRNYALQSGSKSSGPETTNEPPLCFREWLMQVMNIFPNYQTLVMQLKNPFMTISPQKVKVSTFQNRYSSEMSVKNALMRIMLPDGCI